MPSLRELTEYHKPTSIDDALQLLRRPHIRSIFIAGGTGVVTQASHDVQAVIDLSGLNLSYIKSTEQGISLGATTTLQQIIDDKNIRAYADGVLIKAILDTASLNTRNQASIAGSIVGGTSNSPLITTLLALHATLNIRDDQSQRITLSNWIYDAKTLIVEVVLPKLSDHTHVAYEKVARTPADLPIVCVAACGTIENGKIVEAYIALGGVNDRPIMIAQPVTSIEQAQQLAAQSIQPASDYFATAEYRREMIKVLIKRVLENLVRQSMDRNT
jgi:CO/xanthine dehydrogenase FAD-binding subunit